MPIDPIESKKKVLETTTSSIAMLHIPIAISANRKMFIVSRDYVLTLSNSTFTAGVEKSFLRGRYSFVPVTSILSGDVYLQIKPSAYAKGDLIYVLIKDGDNLKKIEIHVRSDDMTETGFNWKIIQ